MHRAATVCAEDRCPEPATSKGRCPQHQLVSTWSGSRAWRRLVAQVIRRDHGICQLCGQPGATSADHIIRRRDGGRDELSNLRACHPACNRRRG